MSSFAPHIAGIEQKGARLGARCCRPVVVLGRDGGRRKRAHARCTLHEAASRGKIRRAEAGCVVVSKIDGLTKGVDASKAVRTSPARTVGEYRKDSGGG